MQPAQTVQRQRLAGALPLLPLDNQRLVVGGQSLVVSSLQNVDDGDVVQALRLGAAVGNVATQRERLLVRVQGVVIARNLSLVEEAHVAPECALHRPVALLAGQHDCLLPELDRLCPAALGAVQVPQPLQGQHLAVFVADTAGDRQSLLQSCDRLFALPQLLVSQRNVAQNRPARSRRCVCRQSSSACWKCASAWAYSPCHR